MPTSSVDVDHRLVEAVGIVLAVQAGDEFAPARDFELLEHGLHVVVHGAGREEQLGRDFCRRRAAWRFAPSTSRSRGERYASMTIGAISALLAASITTATDPPSGLPGPARELRVQHEPATAAVAEPQSCRRARAPVGHRAGRRHHGEQRVRELEQEATELGNAEVGYVGRARAWPTPATGLVATTALRRSPRSSGRRDQQRAIPAPSIAEPRRNAANVSV